MIVIDILHNIFEILPELILGAGPFCVFKGMGTGKDSGKLLFKKIYTDTGVSITENPTNLDIKASGGTTDQSIRAYEISFGCGAGITSSAFSLCVCPDLGYRSISEIAMIGSGPLSNNKYGKLTANCENLIIGGNYNKISNNQVGLEPINNQIIGGYKNCVYYINALSSVNNTSIVGGSFNRSLGTNANTIISGISNCTEYSQNSTIISSGGTKINSNSSAIISSALAYILRSGANCELSSVITSSSGYILDSSHSTIFGNSTKFQSNSYSTVLNGRNNWMKDCSYTSTVVNGYYNHIVPGNDNSAYSTTIFNGFKNCFLNQNSPLPGEGGMRYSSIMNGKYNYFLLPAGSRKDTVMNSNILNGSKNVLTLSDSGLTPSSSIILNGYKNCLDYKTLGGFNPGSIFNGKLNCMYRSAAGNTILSGQNTHIFEKSSYSLVSSSCLAWCTYVGARNSTIISAGVETANYICSPIPNAYSRYNTIINLASERWAGSLGSPIPCNIITTDQSNGGNDVAESVGVVQNSNLILSLYGGNCIVGSASNSVIIAQTSSRIFNFTASINKNIARPRNNKSSIIIGNYNSISNGLQSVILGGYNNRIETTKDSIIIGGASNSIDGWIGAQSNADTGILYWKQSGIVGGCNNILKTKSTFNSKQAHSVVLVGTENLNTSNYAESTTVIQNMCLTDTLSWCTPGTKCDGVGTNSINSITKLFVCNGIITNWNI